MLEIGKGFHHGVERVAVEIAEALVDEEAADAQAARRKGGEGKGEGKAHHKGFAAREGVHVARAVEHIMVYDYGREAAAERLQRIAWAEAGEVMVGLRHEVAEGVSLRRFAETLAVAAADELVEACPLRGVVLRLAEGRGKGGGTLLAVAVGEEARADERALLAATF